MTIFQPSYEHNFIEGIDDISYIDNLIDNIRNIY